MLRQSAYVNVFVLLTGAAFAQSTEIKMALGARPSFEASDVHPSPRSNSVDREMRGPLVRAGRYEVRTATMLDLISTAYGMDPDRVYGGPTWLEWDRYDVIGKLPPGSTTESRKLMLQSLLADRFHLVLHNDRKLLPAYTMTVGKHPLLKESDGAGETGCPFEVKGRPNGPVPEGTTPPTPELEFTCRNMTMAAFADEMRNMPLVPDFLHNRPVVDQTALSGAWDFSFKFPLPRRVVVAGGTAPDNTTFFDVLEKQLAIKLEPAKISLPVIEVDHVDEKPTDNLPDVATTLPGAAAPTEFEVAAIKPTDPSFQGIRLNIEKGGRVNVQGASLKFMIQQIWNLTDDMLVGAPKWLDADRWDIVAKAPAAALTGEGPNQAPIDDDDIIAMVKSLLAERFKLATHMEDRPVSAYTLMAAKPKMKPADPTGRIKCFEGPGPDGKDPREANPVLGRLITCQNMSMARFADMLQGLASGYIHSPVLDATGLDGAWDFTLSFSPIGQLQGGRGGRGGDAPPSPAAGGANAASEPNGALSLLDALPRQLGLKLEMQKRPVQVLVIDHVEQKPTEN